MAGIMLGALGGAGQAAEKIGGRMQQGAIDADLENLRNENAQNRALALEKAREEAGIRGEQRGIMNRATERGMIIDETIKNKPRMTDAEIEAANTKSKAELDFFEQNKDSVLGKKSAEAAAGRDPSLNKLHAIQTQAAQLDLDYKKQETKLPPAVKARGDSIRDEIKTISSAIAKAQAEGMFDATGDNAATLMTRYAGLTSQLDKLLSPYYGEKSQKPDAEKPAANADEVRYDNQGRAYVRGPDGKPVLKNAANPAVNENAKPAAQEFNEAGYSDVQSTIDGARRGDAKAKALLPKLISRGQTNSVQRKQIDTILGQ